MKNLVVDGVKFIKGENTRQIVIDLFSSIDQTFDEFEIDYAYRQGSPMSEDRSMMVVMTKATSCDKILSLKGSLKNTRYRSAFITEDSNNEVRKQKNDISAIAKMAYDAKKKSPGVHGSYEPGP